jgi:hypothetical protein
MSGGPGGVLPIVGQVLVTGASTCFIMRYIPLAFLGKHLIHDLSALDKLCCGATSTAAAEAAGLAVSEGRMCCMLLAGQ